MTDTDTEELRAALSAGPTPGPWRYWACKVDSRTNPPLYDYAQFASLKQHVFRAPLRYIKEPDARYIAAANPERIARLLDALDEARSKLAQARAEALEDAAKMLGDASMIKHKTDATGTWENSLKFKLGLRWAAAAIRALPAKP